jgi:hypothetical protein
VFICCFSQGWFEGEVRGYGIGRPSDMGNEVEAYLLKGLENARWNTA